MVSRLCLLLSAVLAVAASGPQVPVEQLSKGSERVLIATVAETSARYERNEFGDELIVTDAKLTVHEALKGSASPVTLVVDGGTVEGLTLRTSSTPPLARGERGVFFVNQRRDGKFRPHLKGQGILKLDNANRVVGSGLALELVKQKVGQ
jgi:hypothetical protein